MRIGFCDYIQEIIAIEAEFDLSDEYIEENGYPDEVDVSMKVYDVQHWEAEEGTGHIGVPQIAFTTLGSYKINGDPFNFNNAAENWQKIYKQLLEKGYVDSNDFDATLFEFV